MPKQFLDPQGLSQFTENLEHSIVADEYDSSAAYALKDYCVHENLLYRCTTAIPSGESWDPSHWTQVLIGDELVGLNQAATTSTSGLMSATDKTKLNGIESGAEVNVQSDWDAVSGDALILNKPTLGSAASKNVSTSVTSGDPNLVTSGAVYTAISNIPDNDTWRNIKVNGTEKLSADISSGAVDFVNGTNTVVSFNSTGNKVSYDVPVVSSSSAGVAPQGESVSSFDQTSKFLRSDGAWVAPKYTEDTWRPISIDWQSTNDRALHINAGTNITIDQTATDSSQTATINATDTNTTYTFANGTNGFTVTPSDGAAQTVTVTPDLQLEGSASGSVASFNDGGDNIPVKSLVADITGVQAGEGTPSPSNVRAITGWSQAQITRTGKNLCPYLEQGQLSTTTGEEVASDTVRRSGFIRVEAGQTYAFSNLSTSSTQTNKRLRVFYYDRWKTYINNETTDLYDTSVNVTIPSGVSYIRFQASGTVLTETNAQVEKGSTPTTYEPYKGTTYTISLGSTVYGGTLDVTKGILTIDKTCVTLDPSAAWNKNTVVTASNSFTAQAFFANYKREDGLCSHFGVVSSISATEGIYFGTNINIFTPLDLELDTVEKFTQWITGKNIQVLYSLQTPVIINLTKTQVTTLLNENNIYADSGDISVEYFTQSAKDISNIANSSNKMDFSNPTGTGSLSMNRASGSTVGIQSTTLGRNCIASGTRSFAAGQATSATGNNGSFAEGYGTTASGTYGSHAEGRATTASGENSHAEGNNTKAEGDKSHAEGQSTIASGVNSHAEGSGTKATADHAHAEGYQTEANGNVSHAAGFGTVAKHRSQYVFGEYNVPDPSSATISQKGTYVEIVGNGTANVPKNARTLDWSGNETLAGGLKLHADQDASTLTVSSPITAGATYDFASYSDGTVIFVYRPSDASISDYTGIYIRSSTWTRLIPIKEAPNVTTSGYVLTNGNSQALRCAIIST